MRYLLTFLLFLCPLQAAAQDLLALTNRNYSRAVVDYNIALNELVRAQGILPDGIHIEGARR